MKRLLCFILALCLLCGAVSVFSAAAEDEDRIGEFTRRVGEFWSELELKDKLDELELSGLGDDLKALLQDSAALDDDELEARIREIAAAHGVTPDDEQVEKLAKLVRTYEKGADIKEKAEDAREKAAGLMDHLRAFAHKAAGVFQKLGTWLEKFSQSKKS